MSETVDRQKATEELTNLTTNFHISDKEVEIVKGLIEKAQTQEELQNIIEETAVAHDPINIESIKNGPIQGS